MGALLLYIGMPVYYVLGMNTPLAYLASMPDANGQVAVVWAASGNAGSVSVQWLAVKPSALQ